MIRCTLRVTQIRTKLNSWVRAYKRPLHSLAFPPASRHRRPRRTVSREWCRVTVVLAALHVCVLSTRACFFVFDETTMDTHSIWFCCPLVLGTVTCASSWGGSRETVRRSCVRAKTKVWLTARDSAVGRDATPGDPPRGSLPRSPAPSGPAGEPRWTSLAEAEDRPKMAGHRPCFRGIDLITVVSREAS